MPRSLTVLMKIVNQYFVCVLAVPVTRSVNVCVLPCVGYVHALSVKV